MTTTKALRVEFTGPMSLSPLWPSRPLREPEDVGGIAHDLTVQGVAFVRVPPRQGETFERVEIRGRS